MIKTRLDHVKEYLSLTLILSYFIVHNILLVQLGIFLSLYLININFINNLMRSIYENSIIKKDSRALNNNDNTGKSNSININLSKIDSSLTLVEKVEKLGFIPSIDTKNNSSPS